MSAEVKTRVEELQSEAIDLVASELQKDWAKDDKDVRWCSRTHWAGILWDPWMEDWRKKNSDREIGAIRIPSSTESWVILEGREMIDLKEWPEGVLDFNSGNYNSDLWCEDLKEYGDLMAGLFDLWENSPNLYWILFGYADACHTIEGSTAASKCRDLAIERCKCSGE